ncbi:MAG: FKBP-type peptidyl-prolyl cis-trans isomerase [Chitinophagaceae bacterium]|nr:FKBP-type peptidyl-prolyl cis-trans isomerase [Chitinophagaceae bacterium]
MIRTVFILFIFSVFATSCSKSPVSAGCTLVESTLVAPSAEVASLQAWITANRPAALPHASGIFYEIILPGTGTTTPGVCSNITVKYTGYLLNGVKIDENLAGATFILGNLIVGWQKGIPLIKKGGTIYLYIPPTLAYGLNTVGSVPPNSYLKFSIELVDVQ